MLEESIRTSELATRIAAYGALLQEGNNALARYDRWEATPKHTKFAGPRATVRRNMKRYISELQALEKELARRYDHLAPNDTRATP